MGWGTGYPPRRILILEVGHIEVECLSVQLAEDLTTHASDRHGHALEVTLPTKDVFFRYTTCF